MNRQIKSLMERDDLKRVLLKQREDREKRELNDANQDKQNDLKLWQAVLHGNKVFDQINKEHELAKKVRYKNELIEQNYNKKKQLENNMNEFVDRQYAL